MDKKSKKIFLILSVISIPLILIILLFNTYSRISRYFNQSKLKSDKSEIVEPRETRPARRDLPPIPGANLLISVVDEQGVPVEEGIIEVSVQFDGDLAYYDYRYSVSLASLTDGLLGLDPPPSRMPARLFLQVVTPTGNVSDMLVIKNEQYWNSVKATKQDFVATHQFDMKKKGIISELLYND